MKAGKARIEAGPPGLDPTEIPRAVRKAGFTPGAVEITAVGEVAPEDGGRVLHLPGSSGELALSGEMAAGLEPGRRIRVSGELVFPGEGESGPARLRVTEVGEP